MRVDRFNAGFGAFEAVNLILAFRLTNSHSDLAKVVGCIDFRIVRTYDK